MPRRWPRPSVQKAVDRAHAGLQRVGDRRALERLGRRPLDAGDVARAWPGAPVEGVPKPSSTRPRSSSPTGTENERRSAITACIGASPARSPCGINSVLVPRKPTTSASTSPPIAGGRRMRHSSPIAAGTPLASTITPETCSTRPR